AFSHSSKHFFISLFIFPTHFLQRPPHLHLKCFEPFNHFLSHDPCFASIQRNRHISTLTISFLRPLFILLVISYNYLLLNASLAHSIPCFLSSIHLPSSAITDPRYLKF